MSKRSKFSVEWNDEDYEYTTKQKKKKRNSNKNVTEHHKEVREKKTTNEIEIDPVTITAFERLPIYIHNEISYIGEFDVKKLTNNDYVHDGLKKKRKEFNKVTLKKLQFLVKDIGYFKHHLFQKNTNKEKESNTSTTAIEQNREASTNENSGKRIRRFVKRSTKSNNPILQTKNTDETEDENEDSVEIVVSEEEDEESEKTETLSNHNVSELLSNANDQKETEKTQENLNESGEKENFNIQIKEIEQSITLFLNDTTFYNTIKNFKNLPSTLYGLKKLAFEQQTVEFQNKILPLKKSIWTNLQTFIEETEVEELIVEKVAEFVLEDFELISEYKILFSITNSVLCKYVLKHDGNDTYNTIYSMMKHKIEKSTNVLLQVLKSLKK
ncbi:hypothetical protein ABK040_011724 [Willaertia magna]